MSSETDVLAVPLMATGAVVWIGALLWAAFEAYRQLRRRPWLLAIPVALGALAFAFRKQPEVCTAIGVGAVGVVLLAAGLRYVSTSPRLAALVITALVCALAFTR